MELASVRLVRKPWGKTDLRPWSELGHDGSAVGELWFQRADQSAPEPSLLVKLLFTGEALSIQVHPDDAFARSIGLPHGKTEAWYVLSATPEARLALGLKHELSRSQLRACILDGTIQELVQWQGVRAEDTVLVPAGTIHAIGAGLVVAEIQQRSDTTFRLFDHGRQRPLHLDGAVGAAITAPAAAQQKPSRLSEARNVLTQSAFFVLEAVELAPNSHWEVDAEVETWFLVTEGEAAFDLTQVTVGEAMFVEGHRASVRTGDLGAKALLAYVASQPIPNLLLSRNGLPSKIVTGRFGDPSIDRRPRSAAPTRPWGMHS